MSQTKYSDAPEAIVHDDPETVLDENPPETGRAASGSPIKQLGDMKASKFWLLLGLICVVVVGGTVGGAVGGSIAASKTHHAETVTQTPSPSSVNTLSASAVTSSPSATRSQSAVPPYPTSDYVSTNGSTYNSLFLSGSEGVVPPSAGLTFTKVCGVEQYGFNLALAYVTIFEACIELCASLNYWNQDKNCLGVAYQLTGSMPGNCRAHNVTTANIDASFDSAVLLT
ncbi:hypothetical protein N431DRAFT_496658 [Stipitochalara longipes BDJ]|nr:hypothetical protein N431DRAFT_496658 [Stipitochalara longipes BDJ]